MCRPPHAPDLAQGPTHLRLQVFEVQHLHVSAAADVRDCTRACIVTVEEVEWAPTARVGYLADLSDGLQGLHGVLAGLK